jgi:hypothetical protein
MSIACYPGSGAEYAHFGRLTSHGYSRKWLLFTEKPWSADVPREFLTSRQEKGYDILN